MPPTPQEQCKPMKQKIRCRAWFVADFKGILGTNLPQSGRKWDPRSVQNGLKMASGCYVHKQTPKTTFQTWWSPFPLGVIHFWSAGRRRSQGPRGPQNGVKQIPKRIPKRIIFIIRFVIEFGGQNGPENHTNFNQKSFQNHSQKGARRKNRKTQKMTTLPTILLDFHALGVQN